MARMSRTSPDWPSAAHALISAALRDGRARGLAGPDLIAAVDAAYPWGAKAGWPYRVWRAERRTVLGAAGLLRERRRERAGTGIEKDCTEEQATGNQQGK